ncbi:hypothetical protein [Prolixibacter sp. NT017]|nr:hypothetical protein [Prolixibacter sp. NT017]
MRWGKQGSEGRKGEWEKMRWGKQGSEGEGKGSGESEDKTVNRTR